MADPVSTTRLRCIVRGAVQGVGFRPFVYRLARRLSLAGWVLNSPVGVVLEVEGGPGDVESFRSALVEHAPPRARITGVETAFLDPAGYGEFTIRPSAGGESVAASVLPDIATCRDCLAEMRDPSDRRYRYPFINCTNCGPRYSIIERLPYDRPNTVMRDFEMCPACLAEYEDPENRRFHAQPNGCPVCGPRLELLSPGGDSLALREEALLEAERAIGDGRIVAMMGLGGFQLVCDARSGEAVSLLRERKLREEKPFAVLYPGLAALERDCIVRGTERLALVSPESPIVLLDRKPGMGEGDASIAAAVAPGNPRIGAMLPYTPLHHLLMDDLGFPVVATSGNLSEEPMCRSTGEAIERLGSIADLFLVHDRRIARHVDDSIVRMAMDRPVILRRARGYAPLPIGLAGDGPCILAVGPQLKNTIGLASGSDAFLSQHIGDLENPASRRAFRSTIDSLTELYEATPELVACDLHPDYASTAYAETTGAPLVRVQHHLAHVLSCMAENEIEPPVLGVSWDGTGVGTDGTIWGGEFLEVTAGGWNRIASFRTFPLPGGDLAIRVPARAALGLLFEMSGGSGMEPGLRDLPPFQRFDPADLERLERALATSLNCPGTSSVGRIFDVVSSLCDVCHENGYEGQAAMMLEQRLEPGVGADEPLDGTWPLRALVRGDGSRQDPPMVIDWEPMIRGLIADLRQGARVGLVSKRFHDWLARAVLSVAEEVSASRVVVTGGCFQNRYLTERTVGGLISAGFAAYWHQRVPPGVGGVSLGQLVAARTGLHARSRGETRSERQG